MTSVACVGIAVLDQVFQVKTLPTTPGKHRAFQHHEVGGGVAANAAAAIARLGGRASLFSALGDDATGDRIIADLEQQNVATAGIRRVSGQASPLSAVMVDEDGERLIVNHAGPALFIDAPPVTAAEVTGAGAVLADMRWPVGAIPALAAAAAEGKPAIVDCDHDPADAPGIIETASHVVFAIETLRNYAGTRDVGAALHTAATRTGAWVAATAGSDGVYWLDAGALRHGPADQVDVVDTLGAGDVFHGAFALAVAEGRSLHAALRWASASAALKCTRFGGRRGTPAREEVDRFVEVRGQWS